MPTTTVGEVRSCTKLPPLLCSPVWQGLSKNNGVRTHLKIGRAQFFFSKVSFSKKHLEFISIDRQTNRQTMGHLFMGIRGWLMVWELGHLCGISYMNSEKLANRPLVFPMVQILSDFICTLLENLELCPKIQFKKKKEFQIINLNF